MQRGERIGSMFTRVALFLTAITLSFPPPGDARNTTTLSLGGGGLFLSGADPNAAPFAGLKVMHSLIGKNRSSSLGVEGVFLFAPDADVLMLRADALYPLVARRDWKSYLCVGLGGMAVESEEEPLVAGGLTLLYQPNTPAALRLDVRHLREIAADERSGWEVGLLLSYEFGYQPRPRPKRPADSDRDGVADPADRCPDTPKEFRVDRKGCPIDAPDTDGDQVPDFQDRCPGTDKRLKVGPDGCPPDADRDGVPDAVDRCPDTPPTMPIGEDGCVKVRKE